MDNEPYHMRPWDEVLGPVHKVEEFDGYCLALIGKIPVYLPLELAARLRELQDQRVGIIRTETDYRFRVVASTKLKMDIGSNSLGIIQIAI